MRDSVCVTAREPIVRHSERLLLVSQNDLRVREEWSGTQSAALSGIAAMRGGSVCDRFAEHGCDCEHRGVVWGARSAVSLSGRLAEETAVGDGFIATNL